jgi:hypothetical protein
MEKEFAVICNEWDLLYATPGFDVLDGLRIEHEEEIVSTVGMYEPLAGDDNGIYGVSHDFDDLYVDLKLTTDGFLVLINNGYHGDIGDVIHKIPTRYKA